MESLDIWEALSPISETIFQGLVVPLFVFLFFLAIACGVILFITHLIRNARYNISKYRNVVKLPYKSVRDDTGRHGEYLTYNRLKKFERNNAKFLFNLYIPKGNGETTEIDLLMICPKGVFVFESKNYSGWIFGTEENYNWYQTLLPGDGMNRKNSFYNPIMQNKSHIKHLKSLLGEDVLMHSIVVFSERCKLKNIKLSSDDVNVIKRADVFRVVKRICDRIPGTMLSKAKISYIYEELYPYTQVSKEEKAQHVGNINKSNSRIPDERQAEDQNVPKQNVCPRCGGNLVLRTAKRGQNVGNRFYGCSNFPKCRYTRNL